MKISPAAYIRQQGRSVWFAEQSPVVICGGLHHAAHARVGHCGRRILLLLLGQNALRSEEHRGDRSGVLQRDARYLGGVDDTCGQQILVTVVAGVVAERSLALLALLPILQ